MEEKCRWLVRLFGCVARAGGVAAGGKVGGVPGNPVLHVCPAGNSDPMEAGKG